MSSTFAGLGHAAALIAARRTGRRITIHGDYDVDGVCSTAVLLRTCASSARVSTGICRTGPTDMG